jgi:2-amino-4-hydroxy-6-hydroxymethyldihydropteridine diphosphokinase
MHTTYLALGTNLGDKNLNLLMSLAHITEKIGSLSAISSVHETQAWGFESENTFLNMVVRVETPLSPFDVLKTTQEIEKQMGRTAKSVAGYEDRIIDIDIIFYDDLVYQSETLTLPHPLYREREFVMKPLNEIL